MVWKWGMMVNTPEGWRRRRAHPVELRLLRQSTHRRDAENGLQEASFSHRATEPLRLLVELPGPIEHRQRARWEVAASQRSVWAAPSICTRPRSRGRNLEASPTDYSEPTGRAEESRRLGRDPGETSPFVAFRSPRRRPALMRRSHSRCSSGQDVCKSWGSSRIATRTALHDA